MDDKTRTELEAAVYRRLVEHLRTRNDVQNIDMMNLAGFCRNCLSNWMKDAADLKGVPMTKEQSREIVYGEPFEQWKAKHQKEASPAQKAAFGGHWPRTSTEVFPARGAARSAAKRSEAVHRRCGVPVSCRNVNRGPGYAPRHFVPHRARDTREPLVSRLSSSRTSASSSLATSPVRRRRSHRCSSTTPASPLSIRRPQPRRRRARCRRQRGDARAGRRPRPSGVWRMDADPGHHRVDRQLPARRHHDHGLGLRTARARPRL